jgi:hypothetical protein
VDHRQTRSRFYLAPLALWLCLAGLGAILPASPARAGDFWEPLNGPTGGTVNALVRDPGTGALYAGTGYQHGYNKNAGSVFKSTDNGATWTYVSADFFTLTAAINTRVRTLAVSSAGHVFAGLELGGVMRSLNGGASWSRINSGLTDLRVRALAVSAGGELHAATDTVGVFVFNHATATWSPVNDGLTSLDTRAIVHRPGYILVGSQTGGVFKRPTGQPWSSASAGMASLHVNGLSVSPFTGTLFAATDTGYYASDDDAASWQPVIGPFSATLCWTMLDTGTCLVAGTNIGMFRSTDGGTQWSPVADGFTAANVRTLLDDGAGRTFAGSFDDGLFRSTDDGQSWSAANTGLYGLTVTRLLVTGNGRVHAGTITNGIFRTSLYGAPWTGPVLPRWRMFALTQSPWGELYAGNYNITAGQPNGHAWRSSDDGDTWTPLDTGLNASMVSGFAFPGGDEVLCTSAWNPGGVSMSANRGDLWSHFGPPQNVPAYCLTRSGQGDLFFGTEGQNVWRYNHASGTWTNLGLGESQQFSIALNSLGHVFVGNDANLKGVYKSTANGDNLQPLAAFPGNYGYTICITPDDDLYVGTRDSGIQYSHDGGASWTSVNSGIPVSSCQTLTLGPDDHLYAGVAGFGVYRSAAPVTTRLPGDIDADGNVDLADFTLLESCLGGPAIPFAPPCLHGVRSDFDGDGDVDLADVTEFVAEFQTP